MKIPAVKIPAVKIPPIIIQSPRHLTWSPPLVKPCPVAGLEGELVTLVTRTLEVLWVSVPDLVVTEVVLVMTEVRVMQVMMEVVRLVMMVGDGGGHGSEHRGDGRGDYAGIDVGDDRGVGAEPGLLLEHHQHVDCLAQLALAGQGAGRRQLLVTHRAGGRVKFTKTAVNTKTCIVCSLSNSWFK